MVTYSQKYCLVHFIKPLEDGVQFHMSEWPLHTTLADVFAVDRELTNIDTLLAQKLSQYLPVKTTALQDSTLGTTPVVLLDKTQELLQLHTNVVALLEKTALYSIHLHSTTRASYRTVLFKNLDVYTQEKKLPSIHFR